jgi:hypothetical protein
VGILEQRLKICEFCGDEEKTETCAGCLTHLRICEKKMFEMYCTLGGIGLALESGATIENIGGRLQSLRPSQGQREGQEESPKRHSLA